MGLPRWIGVAGLIAFMLVMVGCSPTMVTFDGPPGTVMFVDNKPYHLPAAVELWRPAGVGQSNRYNVSLNYSTAQVQDAKAEGHIDVFGYTESDVDKMSVISCIFDEAQLAKLNDGTVLIFKAQTASRQPLYELKLVKK